MEYFDMILLIHIFRMEIDRIRTADVLDKNSFNLIDRTVTKKYTVAKQK